MVQRKSVLVILQNSPIEDDMRVIKEINALKDSGYAVSLICPNSRFGKQNSTIEDVKIYRYRSFPAGDDFKSYVREYLFSWLKIASLSFKAHKEVGFDVIHTCNPPDIFFTLGIIYKLFGKKFVFDQHDLSPDVYLARFSTANPTVYKVLRVLEFLTYKTADAVLSTNQSYKEIAIRRGKVQDKSIYVVRNGPFLDFAEPLAVDLSLKTGHEFMVCCMGEMAPQDGVENLLRSANYLINEKGRDDICFTLVGDGSSAEVLKQMVVDMGIAEHVVFTGWIRDHQLLCRYLATADVCISPESSGPFNEHSTFIKVLDYMSAGKPVVAFDLPETRFSAGDSALYAEPNDTVALGKNIEVLLADQDLRQKMGQIGKRRVQEVLCWEYSLANLTQAYSELFS